MKRLNKFYLVAIILTIIYGILLFFAFWQLEQYAVVSGTVSEEQLTVVIDAGHGGEDGGAVANDVVEKEINLSIANKLSAILKISGYNVICTRDSDTMINTEGKSLKERKISDMKNRLSIYNGSDNNVVISIHQNKFPQEQYYGAQIFYSPNNPDSAVLAEAVRNSIFNLTQPENTRECKPADSSIYLLYNAKVPAIIAECGFISNSNEAGLLKSEEYQGKIAFAVFTGFKEYLNKR